MLIKYILREIYTCIILSNQCKYLKDINHQPIYDWLYPCPTLLLRLQYTKDYNREEFEVFELLIELSNRQNFIGMHADHEFCIPQFLSR